MREEKKTVIGLWTPVFFWMLLISVISSIPGRHMPRFGMLHLDKIIHFAEYYILGFLLIRAFVNSYKIRLAKSMIMCILIAALYAAFDEWHQSFVRDRTADIMDFLADLAGLSAGVFLYRKRVKNADNSPV